MKEIGLHLLDIREYDPDNYQSHQMECPFVEKFKSPTKLRLLYFLLEKLVDTNGRGVHSEECATMLNYINRLAFHPENIALREEARHYLLSIQNKVMKGK